MLTKQDLQNKKLIMELPIKGGMNIYQVFSVESYIKENGISTWGNTKESALQEYKNLYESKFLTEFTIPKENEILYVKYNHKKGGFDKVL